MDTEADALAIALALLMARAGQLSKKERAALTGRVTNTLQALSRAALEHHANARELADLKRRIWNLEHPHHPPEN